MLWIYRFLKGYLIITVKGECSERILNLCARHGITLWNSRIIKNGIETSICIKDFLELPEIVKGSGLRIHIIQKRGLPIKLNKNRKRVGLFVGMVCSLIILQIASSYIWVIDIEGNRKVKSEEILKACRKIGITEGIRSNSISPKIQREQLLLELDSLAWASLNVEGSRLTVNVSEIKALGKEEDVATNLKADADGIIKKVNVTSGNCLVKTGDTVKKGDILVSGILEASDGTRFVKSAGVITAFTTRSVTVEGDFMEIKELETGEVKVKRLLDVFTFKIPLYLGSEINGYNSNLNSKQISVFGKSLPIKIYTKEFRFTKKEKKIYEREQLIDKLRNDIAKELKKLGVESYTTVSEEIAESEKGMKITAIIKSEEDITFAEPIHLSSEN